MGCASSSPDKKLIFGADLEKVDKDEPNPNVPKFIVECVKIIEENYLDSEGIYRLSGSKPKIDALIKKMDTVKSPNKYNTLKDEECNTITGALKQYFRELPIDLMPPNTCDVIPDEMDKPDGIEKIKAEVNNLDVTRKDILKYFVTHLKNVEKHNKVNQMTASNLGTTVGPSLFSNMNPESESNQHYRKSNRLLETLILNYDAIF